jgi:hypothetical protein
MNSGRRAFRVGKHTHRRFTVWVDYLNDIKNKQTDYLYEIADKTPILMGDLILVEGWPIIYTTAD